MILVMSWGREGTVDVLVDDLYIDDEMEGGITCRYFLASLSSWSSSEVSSLAESVS